MRRMASPRRSRRIRTCGKRAVGGCRDPLHRPRESTPRGRAAAARLPAMAGHLSSSCLRGARTSAARSWPSAWPPDGGHSRSPAATRRSTPCRGAPRRADGARRRRRPRGRGRGPRARRGRARRARPGGQRHDVGAARPQLRRRAGDGRAAGPARDLDGRIPAGRLGDPARRRRGARAARAPGRCPGLRGLGAPGMPGRGPWAAAQFSARRIDAVARPELRPAGVHVALLVADGIIRTERTAWPGARRRTRWTAGGRRGGGRLPGLAAPAAWTHELVMTPAGDTWVP